MILSTDSAYSPHPQKHCMCTCKTVQCAILCLNDYQPTMALTHKTPFLYESVLMIDQIHTKTVLHL
jgi:hypothetical protein